MVVWGLFVSSSLEIDTMNDRWFTLSSSMGAKSVRVLDQIVSYVRFQQTVKVSLDYYRSSLRNSHTVSLLRTRVKGLASPPTNQGPVSGQIRLSSHFRKQGAVDHLGALHLDPIGLS